MRVLAYRKDLIVMVVLGAKGAELRLKDDETFLSKHVWLVTFFFILPSSTSMFSLSQVATKLLFVE